MVSLVVGFPGSGKSYYAVKKIYDILSIKDNKPSQYEIIYTNIGGIKFDYFPDSKVLFKKLKESDLIEYLTECFKIYELHKNDDNVDDYLIEYSKTQNFYNSLIIFDECHDFFGSQDKVKIFWLTYHRHLNHEIILLTQNKSLINTKYRAIPEQFIEAQPRSKKLFSNTLNYKHYSSFAMRKSDQFNTSSIKTNKDIFDLYQSGNKSTQKSILVKFIVILGFGLIVAIFLFMNLLGGFADDTNTLNDNFNKLGQTHNINNTTTKTELSQENIKDDDTKDRVKNSVKNKSDKYFNIQITFNSDSGYEIYNHHYKKQYFEIFTRTTKSRIIYKTTILQIEKYLIEKLILRTSKAYLAKYFLIPINTNKPQKRKRDDSSNNSKR